MHPEQWAFLGANWKTNARGARGLAEKDIAADGVIGSHDSMHSVKYCFRARNIDAACVACMRDG